MHQIQPMQRVERPRHVIDAIVMNKKISRGATARNGGRIGEAGGRNMAPRDPSAAFASSVVSLAADRPAALDLVRLAPTHRTHTGAQPQRACAASSPRTASCHAVARCQAAPLTRTPAHRLAT
jgi:hypothetical protein